MRQIKQSQPTLREPGIHHEHREELQTIDRILRENPTIFQFVDQDLKKNTRYSCAGRKGMTAEQVVKAALIKQLHGFSYKVLYFHLLDSRTFSEFVGFGMFDSVPRRSTLADNIKKISFETWEKIHRIVMGVAQKKGVEKWTRIRTDATVVASSIHHPSDSSLLWDCVRVLTRILNEAKALKPDEIRFTDHTRRAKRRYLGIINAKNAEIRQNRYKDLFRVTRKVLNEAAVAIGVFRDCIVDCPQGDSHRKMQPLCTELLHFHALGHRVLDQATRRVIHKQSVPSQEKIVSIFESHTDIVVKGNRDPEYGHKIYLSGSNSGLVVDCIVESGNPADSQEFETILNRFGTLYERMPRKLVLDGCFASKDNLGRAKSMGIEDIVFSKKRGIPVHKMVSSTWKYKCLRNFRAGVEGLISYLKNSFGLKRCNWKGFESFKSYVLCSMLTHNLLILARHLM